MLPHAGRCAKLGFVPGGTRRNMDYFGNRIEIADGVPAHLRDLLFDPQTSGGLLLAVPEASAGALLARLQDTAPDSRIVGQVLPLQGMAVRVI